ncbi:MAG: Flagellar biosynthetic protein FliQ [Alphaproteobacteria bacterium MarineAlpha9_Bin4]|nr:flagellar biosynthetic protein FliQ [Pelagibacterales bacterium]PPR26891.1 MAG: Flagellar biosynthetic protein FliQ [Alphaproteobacteria bacterium MarineAlpha9_Bin4]|tara:strand:+ start:330 stop:596 length:267 start_codon:yes stop_codon:yes gene_type:complete
MGYENNIEMVSMAFWTVLKLAGPVLIVALVVGLTIGIIQAATSINEMTLSFVPKVVIVILTIAIFTNYLLTGLTDYFMFIFERVATLR